MNTIKTIIFDFGNVVGFFDHRRAVDRLVGHAAMSADELYALICDDELEDDVESGRMKSGEFLRRFRELGGLRCDLEFIASTLADIFHANEEVCSLLPRLKPRYRILLGSNTNEVHARHFRVQFADSLRHFDHLVLSYEIGVRKPQRPFFENCQRFADCKPSECLFIDDLAANVAGARAFGWNAMQYAADNGLAGELQAAGVIL